MQGDDRQCLPIVFYVPDRVLSALHKSHFNSQKAFRGKDYCHPHLQTQKLRLKIKQLVQGTELVGSHLDSSLTEVQLTLCSYTITPLE